MLRDAHWINKIICIIKFYKCDKCHLPLLTNSRLFFNTQFSLWILWKKRRIFAPQTSIRKMHPLYNVASLSFAFVYCTWTLKNYEWRIAYCVSLDMMFFRSQWRRRLRKKEIFDCLQLKLFFFFSLSSRTWFEWKKYFFIW